MSVTTKPGWTTRGKSLRQLIEELQSFSDQDLEVKISVDDGASFNRISLVQRKNRDGESFCGLVNCENKSH